MSAFNKPKGNAKRKHFLNEDTVNYYKRVADSVSEGFPSDNEKDLFLNNVFTQLADEALPVCQCPLTSHIVEQLVSLATPSNLKTLLTVFSTDWQVVVQDKCASHVLQKCLLVIPSFVSDRVLTYDVEAVEADIIDDRRAEDFLIQVILELSAYILENLEDSLTHVYSSHILRGILQVLGGTCVGNKVMRSRASRDRNKQGLNSHTEITFSNFEVPDLFKKNIRKICRHIFKSDNFNVHLTDSNANPVIQTLLLVLFKVNNDLCQKYIHKVTKASRIKGEVDGEHKESVKLPPVVLDSVGSFLVEQLVGLASENVYEELFVVLFKGRLLLFALHPLANFVLQKFIRSCKDKDMFQVLVDELGENLEDILAASHFGVIVALAEMCHKLSCREEKFTQLLQSAFHCLDPAEHQIKFAPLIASFTTYDVLFNAPDDVPVFKQVNYHGSVLLQHMLRFSKTKAIVTSLLDMKPVELKTMSCDACGSHVMTVFFESSSVGEKWKEAMLNKLKGFYVEMACSSSGSRVLDTVWKCVSIKHKTPVAVELCGQEEKVRSDRFGRHCHRNFALRLFVNRRSDWMAVQGADMKKRKMFTEILDTDRSKYQKKNKRKSQEMDMDASNPLLLKEEEEDGSSSTLAQKELDKMFSHQDHLSNIPASDGHSKKSSNKKGKKKR